MTRSTRYVASGLLLVLSCVPKPASPVRDRHRGDAYYDRRAVAYYVGTPEAKLKTDYLSGDCSRAPDEDQRNFCDGKLGAIKDPNIVAFAHGMSDRACERITNEDFKLYCQASWSGYAWPSWCERIGDKRLGQLCTTLNKKLPPPPDGDTSPPAGDTAEQGYCIPDGAEIKSMDPCCSGLHKWRGNVTVCCHEGDNECTR